MSTFRRTAVFFFVAAVVIFSPAHSVASYPSANIPLDSWVYPALDKVSGLGLIQSSLQGARPFTRLEAARQISEARKALLHMEASPVARELLRRLENEFREQLNELGEVEDAAGSSYIKPLRSISLKYINQDGHPLSITGTNATQFPLNFNNYGIDYVESSNGQLTFEGDARLGYLLLDWRPLLLVRDNGEETASSFRALGARAALGLGPLEFSVGRQSLWWGQGRHGSLVLTNNAKPLDMIRVTNPVPSLLPWVFKYLGPFRFDVFWSRLEEDRVVPEPYFAGLRLDFKPLPWWEIGASRAVMFGGDGRPDVDFSDFITILGGKNLEGDEDNSNSVAALDTRIKLPFLWNAEIYGELGGEDEAGGFISNKSWLAGIYLPQIEPTKRASLRLEYADLSHIDANSPIWYRHGIYQSGYTYEGKIMGHHTGGGSEDLYAELEILLPRDFKLSLGFDYEERGADQILREKHRQPFVKLDCLLGQSLELNFQYALDEVENVGFVPGNDLDYHFAFVSATYRW